MTSYVVLGHGGFNPESDRYPKEILVPQDTTLTFWSEAGQALVIPAKSGDSDYARVAPVFNQLKQAEPTLGPTKVTYNYAIYPDDTESEREAARDADWNGAQLIMLTRGKKYLCQDTEGKCPTPELLTRSDEDALKPESWMHHCDGILGQYGGGGNDIHWVACTSFMIDVPELPVLDTAGKTGPGLAYSASWTPKDSDRREVAELNQKNVKDTKDGQSVAVVVGGGLVLIGNNHDNRVADFVSHQGDMEQGEIEVTKSSIFTKGKGTLEVRGIASTANRTAVESALNGFSDKDVVFA
jgi:hypothetical protein